MSMQRLWQKHPLILGLWFSLKSNKPFDLVSSLMSHYLPIEMFSKTSGLNLKAFRYIKEHTAVRIFNEYSDTSWAKLCVYNALSTRRPLINAAYTNGP